MPDETVSRRLVLRIALLAGATTLAGCDADAQLATKVSGRKPAWKRTFTSEDDGMVGSGDTDLFPYSLAVSGGTIYASVEGRLHAFDAAGHQRWESPHGQYDASSKYGRTAPRLLDGTLYAVRNEPGGKGTLNALDPASGRLRWSFSPGGWLSPPSASGGHAAVSSEGHLYGLDAASGKERWRIGNGGSQFLGAPAIAGSVVCAVDIQGVLGGVDVDTGQSRWTQSGGPNKRSGRFDPHASAVTDARAVYVHSSGVVWAVSPSDGEVRWSTETDQKGVEPATVSGGTIYAGASGNLSAIDASGSEQWKAALPAIPGPSVTSPAAADGAVTVTGPGRVSCFDAATGKSRWTAGIKDSVGKSVELSNAVMTGRLVFVLAEDRAAVDDAGDKSGPVNHLYAFTL
ncbi:hypothetical protein E1293_46030 [Actinomadura darangshiensis]|uniref:Pyrrolo-quinoline quinone repeat domain-containing protein n=1 Tax=Actinomadura darangshiensis TaxID=705336 RepID=A0A4R4ZM84_9ACTN|nr:PQQ-binding-like beta-propeller repeat protein [Actinomadura darangshiensis]TDD59951.1 hypothetical protein E1293_46030 [Actinomadura darangshiensis]